MAACPWKSSAFAQTHGGDVILTGVSKLSGGTKILGASVTIGNVTLILDGRVENYGAIGSAVILGGQGNASVGTGSIFENYGTGTVSGLVANFGGSASMPGVDNSGKLNGGLLNQAGGFAVNYSGGTIAGVTANAGTFDNGGIVATLSNTGTATNEGSITGAVGVTGGSFTNSSGGTVGGLVTNSAGISLTSPGVANYGALNAGLTNQTSGFAVNYSGGTIAGLTVNAGTFDNAGIFATLSNTGTATNEGSIAGGATVSGGTLTTTGTISGGVINSATVNAAGTIYGAILNIGGTFTVTGGNLAGDSSTSFTNSGSAQLLVTGGNFTNLTTISNTSTASPGIDVGATYQLSAQTLSNGTGATISDYGTIMLSGSPTNNNSGTIHVYSTGTLTATAGGITNSGTITVDAGGKVSDTLNNTGMVKNSGVYNADVNNSGAGTITNTSTGTWTGNVTNTSSASPGITNAGTWIGDVQANTGTINNTGTWNGNVGTVTPNAGTIYSDAPTSIWNGTVINGPSGMFIGTAGLFNGAVTNTGTFNVAGTLTAGNGATLNNMGLLSVGSNSFTGLSSFTNEGSVSIANGTIGSAYIDNAGWITASGALTTFNSNFNNAGGGIIDMRNGSPTDVTTIIGNFLGGGFLGVDINTATGQSDRLVITGTALGTTGTTVVYFNILQNGFVVALPVVLTGAGTNTTAFSGSIPDWGTISYSFVPDGNNWVVKSYLNHSFGPLADIGGALASIATVFQQPASSYVSDKSNAKTNELFCGTWARTDFDRLLVHSASTVTASGAPVAPLSTSQNINYTAIESGLDCGLLRIDGTAWNAHFGLMGGEIDGKVSQTDGLGYTDLHIPELGVYAFFRNNGFVFDLSVRRSFADTEFTIAQAGLLKTPVGGIAVTTAAYTSYTFELQKNLLLMPYAGMSWTRSELSDFEIYTNVGGMATGLVAPNANEDSMGRLGIQLSYVQQLTDTFYLRPFAGVSGWHAFENGTSLKYFVTNGTVVDVSTPAPRDFMQVDGGLSFAENSIQASGYIKGVYKEGSDIKGESLVLGGRFNF